LAEEKRARVLIADDEYNIREGLREGLEREDYAVDTAEDGKEAFEKIQSANYQAGIFDIKMPRIDGLTLLGKVREVSPSTGVILVTAFGDVASAVEAMRHGAYDYLTKPVDLKRLRLSLQHLLEHQELIAENKELRAKLGPSAAIDLIVRRSQVMQAVVDTIEQAAMTDVPVLIRGTTGTGKELVARAIHQRSRRSGKPLVPTNCGAIPESLFESELFGYVKGAFTGANSDKAGMLAAAKGGTLFLDEVGEIPPQNQADLLRVLEDRKYTPIGSTRAIDLDARVIFATNRDLEKEVREGRFREDLYYRINVVPIQLPPLRDRGEDIPVLVDTFLEELCALHHKERKRLTEDAMERILTYAWPGNVRELKNAIERVVVTCKDRDVTAEALPARVQAAPRIPETVQLDLGSSIGEAEAALIQATLEHVTSNRRKAAEILGISLRSLQYKLKQFQDEAE
jgi:DNA-binding NtrC family response regulator